MKKTVATLVLMSALLFAGCAESQSPIDEPAEVDSLVQVKASFYPLAYVAEQVGGDRVEVQSLTPAGVDPHSFEPTARQVASIYDADLFLFNGAMVDAWAEAIHDDLQTQGVNVVEMTAHFDLIEHEDEEEHDDEEHEHDDPDEGHEDDHAHDHGGVDPHIWMDPVLMTQQAELVRDQLIEIDPENKLTYETNAQTLIAQLMGLDQSYTTGLSACSKDTIVVAHDAFNYLAARYGFEILAINGLSPDAQPSSQQLAELAETLESEDIQYVFFESLTSPKLSETLANEVGAQTLELNPLEGLTDTQFADGENYDTIMRQNLSNLMLALECQ